MNVNKRLLFSIIFVVLVIVCAIGITYAFFAYTTTGVNNEFSGGSIHFQANDTMVDLTNAFPVSSTEANTVVAGDNNPDVAVAIINVSGRTTYEDGIDFTLEMKNFINETNADLSLLASVSQDTGITLTNVASTLNSENTTICNGHIVTSSTDLTATITLKFYFDLANYLISDTPTAPKVITYANGRTIISTEDWNGKAVSFKVQARATNA